jgi:glutamine synthetase
LASMADATLIFAPHAGSYDRLVPGAHAPTGIGWAYENRTASIRVPNGPPAARRLEHRVPGGDANPYLVLAAILGGMELGLADKITPPAPLTGNAYTQELPQIPDTWQGAVRQFAGSKLMQRLFPARLIDNFTRTKQQEIDVLSALSPQDLQTLYLDSL